MYHTILFDLDGTLTDPGLGITNSVMYALQQQGRPVPERSALYKFIGPPLEEGFSRYCGFNADETRQAVTDFRVYFRKQGIFENTPYPGIEAMLQQLRDAGKTLLVATSKPQEFAVKILQHFGLDGYFDFVAGATMDGSRSKKADVIAYALAQQNICERSGVVMIGDREHDILGAKQTGLASIGVLYGYGSRAELEAAGATHIAATVEDIPALVL